MSRINADIDIDVPDREQALASIGQYTSAAMINADVLKPHNVGIYLQEIPEFMDTGIASIDYKKAPEHGFFKIDILTNSVYDLINTEDDLDKLLEQKPDWSLLLREDVVTKLSQIHRYHREIVKWKPRSVPELAMFIAMIRPSKKHLMSLYDWDKVKETIWQKPEDGTAYFKMSHAIAYAMSIVVQLNLITTSRL